MANVGACWARAGTLKVQHSRGGKRANRDGARRRRGVGTENGEAVLSLVTRENTMRARTGGDVLTKERLKEKEPRQRAAATRGGGAVTRRVGEKRGKTAGAGGGEKGGEERLPLAWRDRGKAGVARARREGEGEGRERKGGSERASSNTPSRES